MILLNKLITIGTNITSTEEEKRRTTLLNKAILIMGLPGIPYAILFYIAGNIELSLLTLFFLIAYSISYIFNYFYLHTTAKVSMVLFTSLAVLIFSKILGQEAGIYLYFFSIAATTRILFSTKQKFMSTFSFTIPSIGFFIYALIPFKFPITIRLDPMFLRGSFILSSIISFTLIYFSILYYTKSIENSEQKLLSSNNELTKTLKEARQRKLMLEKASQQTAFATLSRGIAHEIKNPMAMILSGMELIIENINNQKQTLKFAELVKTNILRLKTITTTMLNYGSPVSKKRSHSNINHILENAIQVAHAECEKRHITINEQLSRSISTTSTNADALHQAFLNLLLNSIEAIESKGTILVSTKLVSKHHPCKTKKAIKIVIKDSGPGIKEEIIEKIYDPFYSTKYGNIGLGLPIVLKTMNDLNGHMDIKVKEKESTKIILYIPHITLNT